MTEKATKEEIVHLGEILVDSGQIEIKDPCHDHTDGILVSTGYGDGIYPVLGKVVNGRVMEVFIDFDPFS